MTPRQAWLLVAAAILATLLRLNFWAFESVDFRIHTSQWHLALLTRGFPAFADPFDVYTPRRAVPAESAPATQMD
jgi:hypothetical protein